MLSWIQRFTTVVRPHQLLVNHLNRHIDIVDDMPFNNQVHWHGLCELCGYPVHNICHCVAWQILGFELSDFNYLVLQLLGIFLDLAFWWIDSNNELSSLWNQNAMNFIQEVIFIHTSQPFQAHFQLLISFKSLHNLVT
jgi:hypothetical protein